MNIIKEFEEWLRCKGYSASTIKQLKFYVKFLMNHDLDDESKIEERFEGYKYKRHNYLYAYRRFSEFLQEVRV